MALKTVLLCDICGQGFSMSGSVPKRRMISHWRGDGGSCSQKKSEVEIYKCKVCRKGTK